MKFGVDNETMLQVVDAERGSFPKSDGSQMTGDFQSTRVRRRERGLQLGAGDMHVCLERVRAL
jgi:hypothetical protein